MPYNRRQSITGQATRLDNIAKKLHAENVLVNSEKPGLYKNNPWIKKSLVISGKSRKIQNDSDTVLPNTVNFSLPSNWRM